MSQKKAKKTRAWTKKQTALIIGIGVALIVVLFLGVFLGLALKNEGVGAEAFTDSDFINKVFPSGLWDFVINLVAFIILLLIVFFIGYKPVTKAMKARADAIEKSLADAEESKRVAKLAADASEVTIEEGKKAAEKILSDAKKQAGEQANAIVAAAKEEASQARKQADIEIAQAKEQSRQDVQQEIVDVALAASSKVLGREVTGEDNERLVSDFVSSLNGSEGGRS